MQTDSAIETGRLGAHPVVNQYQKDFEDRYLPGGKPAPGSLLGWLPDRIYRDSRPEDR